MTIAVDLGRKATKQTNKQTRSNLVLAISANIADVHFYHNTIAVIGPHFKQTVTGILSVDSFNVR